MEPSFAEQYRHPQWQRRRLERLQAADYSCERCGDTETTLHVHHKRYVKGRMVWEYADDELGVLCEPCHEEEHRIDAELRELIEKTGKARARGILAGFNCIEPSVGELVERVYLDDPYDFSVGVLAFVSLLLRIGDFNEVATKIIDRIRPSPPTAAAEWQETVDKWLFKEPKDPPA